MNKEIRKCIVCQREFYIRTSNSKQPLKRKRFRSRQSVNCSDNCSRIYKRVREHILSNKYNLLSD